MTRTVAAAARPARRLKAAGTERAFPRRAAHRCARRTKSAPGPAVSRKPAWASSAAPATRAPRACASARPVARPAAAPASTSPMTRRTAAPGRQRVSHGSGVRRRRVHRQQLPGPDLRRALGVLRQPLRRTRMRRRGVPGRPDLQRRSLRLSDRCHSVQRNLHQRRDRQHQLWSLRNCVPSRPGVRRRRVPVTGLRRRHLRWPLGLRAGQLRRARLRRGAVRFRQTLQRRRLLL